MPTVGLDYLPTKKKKVTDTQWGGICVVHIEDLNNMEKSCFLQ